MMDRDIEYENNNIAYDYSEEDGGIKCKNYELCDVLLPKLTAYLNITSQNLIMNGENK